MHFWVIHQLLDHLFLVLSLTNLNKNGPAKPSASQKMNECVRDRAYVRRGWWGGGGAMTCSYFMTLILLLLWG